jgi:uncharacterized protein (TIGR00156 family)
MRRLLAFGILCLFLSSNAMAQFTGPTSKGIAITVEQARNASVGKYITVTGNIVSHLREDYYTFQDETGEIRVEIENAVWNNRKVSPETKVTLSAEVDRSIGFTVYLWVESLKIVE